VNTWNVTIDGNLFSSSTRGPSMVTWGGSGDVYETFSTPAQLAAAKNPGWRNAQTAVAQPFADMRDDIAANTAIARPLPSAVASLLGIATGTVMLGSGR